MKNFKHRHVMPLIGVCLDSGVGVVMPFMANGSVLSYLKRERETLLISDEADIEQVRRYLEFDRFVAIRLLLCCLIMFLSINLQHKCMRLKLYKFLMVARYFRLSQLVGCC